MWTGPDIWTPVERITEANGTVEGRKGREGSWARGRGRIDSVRNTRFQLLGYHFIKPGDSFHVPFVAGEERPSWMARERHVISNERRNGTDLVHKPRRGLLLLSFARWERDQFSRAANVNLSTFSASLGIDMTNRWQPRILPTFLNLRSFESIFLRFFLSFFLSEAITSKEKEAESKSAKKWEIFRISN